MELARHSDPKLTLKTYARVGMHNLSRVLDGMPEADPRPRREAEALRATGTDDRLASPDNDPPHSGTHSVRRTGKTSAASRGEIHQGPSGTGGRNPLRLAELGTDARRGATNTQSRGERIRTSDLLTPSQMR